MSKLMSWKIQDIQKLYQTFGVALEGYREDAKRAGIILPFGTIKAGDIIEIEQFNADGGLNAIRLMKDVEQINKHLKVLDTEIARRNKLVGVL